MPFNKGHEFSLRFQCEEDGFRIFVDNKEFTFYKHRLPCKNIHKVEMTGKVKLFKVTYVCKEVSLIYTFHTM